MMRDLPGGVLIVDDETAIAAMIQDQLADRGIAPTTTATPGEAKALIATGGFDVVISDVVMPQVSGLDLLAYTRETSPHTRVVLITGNSRREWVSQALLLGAFDYVEKPFREGQLADTVAAALAGAANHAPLAARAAQAMEAEKHARLASLESVRALARAVEAKDPYTRRHSEQVAHYAVHLARAMNLSPDAVESLRVASLLHDIGKIGVPDHILAKPGPLTEAEFEHVQRHPGLGADILSNITLFGHEAQLVRYHHERWDGSGYEARLVGEETPLGARILQVADSIDAMLMERTYKRGYPVEAMLRELTRCAGTHFDPAVAAVAADWCRANEHQLVLPGRPVDLAAAAGV